MKKSRTKSSRTAPARGSSRKAQAPRKAKPSTGAPRSRQRQLPPDGFVVPIPGTKVTIRSAWLFGR